ncbi:MAG: hypothetical protein EU530_11850 [Promethearchaeota archaeon]|nr:MAG: hypothetical protein EU530_11850 [Candidatus Lokiarchaeota archaeon]
MKEEEKNTHEKFGKSLFNRTWELMDKKDRTPKEDIEMIHTAHASAYHWSQIGEPINFQRGEWQISRVYAVLNQPLACLFHAQRCLEITSQNDIKDFDLAFAYEAMARAHAISGNIEEKEKYIKCAKKAAEIIKDEEDKKYTLSEIESIK